MRPGAVALRKESVDRNIDHAKIDKHDSIVALRKESVDRNPVVPAELTTLVKSLSARRAWIEIGIVVPPKADNASRSPQGERG